MQPYIEKDGTFGLTFEMISPRDLSDELTDYGMRQLMESPQEGKRKPKARKKVNRKRQRQARRGNR